MNTTSKFQIVIIGVFIFFIIIGVFFFATYKGRSAQNQIPPITIWGTFPADTFSSYLSQVNQTLAQPLQVNYVYKPPQTFSEDFIGALARGQGPDGILIPADMLLTHMDKITAIPYSALPQRTFMDTFVQEGEVYLTGSGVTAIPFALDPLVMYWNRDTYSTAGFATPPKAWPEFMTLVQKMTTKDANGNIRRSAVAMGDFSNVANSREILGTLMMQVGNPITAVDSTGALVATLKTQVDPSSALSFFTQFVNPNNPAYSWNKSMPNSRTAFVSGQLATYFGFASEIKDLRDRNPNLNFDIASVPQLATGGVHTSYARMYGFSIVRTSPNQSAVFQVFTTLSNSPNLTILMNKSNLPSVRRDVIAAGTSDPYISVFNQTALTTRTWLDADPDKTYDIWNRMINSISSGAKSMRDAIIDADDEMDIVLKQATQ